MKRLLALAALLIATTPVMAAVKGVTTQAAAPPVINAVTVTTTPPEPRLSIETLAAIKAINVTDGQRYGAGVGVGYRLNSWLTGRARAISYHDDPGGHWRGPAIDEGSLLLDATLYRTSNKALALSAIGGADYDFELKDAGVSAGLRATLALSKNVSLVAESRIRHWFASDTREVKCHKENCSVDGKLQNSDLANFAGVQVSW